MTASINNTGRPGYIYDQATDAWILISGKTDTTGSHEWSSDHTFLSTVSIVDHLIGKKGINNFLNPSARDSAIPTPTSGTICFLRQDGIGNTINQVQYWDGSSWIGILPDPTGNEGKFLQTDGIITSWQDITDGTVAALLFMGG